MLPFSAFVALALTASPAAAGQDDSTRLLRFPDIHGDTVVFCYGGDLWKAPTGGGTATRLTAHPGQEVFPRFSPDGEWIAFTGQYDGDEQVYVMPSSGGVPKRLTWYPARGPLPPRWGYDHQVYGWTPDGAAVFFRSLRDAGGGSEGRLYSVPVAGGLPTAMPMPNSGAGDLSPDGKRVVYSPLFRDFRHWKRYEGGWAQSLYVFDLETAEHTPLAHSPRTERDPMWIGGTVVFVSDRDDRLNLYRADPNGGTVEQLTAHDPYDVRWPSTDHGTRVVYELNGGLRVFDLDARTDVAIEIAVPDDGLWKRPRRISVGGSVGGFGLSPKGERAVFTARGEVFSAPAEKGRTRNLTRSSGAHDRLATWSPDGATIAYVSDASGEDEIWLVDASGGAAARQLTSGHAARLNGIRWSPDGERIAMTDYLGRLSVVKVEDGTETPVADDPWWGIGDAAWSPDGGHLAFSLRNEAGVQRVHAWSVADGALRQVTSDLFAAWSPSWGPEGDYLYYLSDRAYAPQISDLEWDYAGNDRAQIYALALRKDVEPLFPPQDDEVAAAEEAKDDSKEEGDAEGDDESEDDEAVEIDFDGLASRVMRVPVGNDNYGGLSAIDGHLLYVTSGAFVYGGSSGDTKLHRFSLEDREAKEVASGVSGYALSADRKKLLVRKGGGFHLHDAAKGGEPKAVSTSGMEMDLDPEAEWGAVFAETWRLFRDYFYVPNMHGYDWEALRTQYAALLPHVAHRSDLNYVISEMIAELNAGHTYVSGGDYEIPDRARVGLPGARFDLDGASGRYRVASILPGHNEESKYRSPLTEVGVDVSVGDYVLAIDGQELSADDNPYRLLQHQEGAVTWTVNDRPTMEGAREVRYRPLSSEASLVYLDWVLANHARVTEATDGRVGYLHIPNMGADGIAEFIKWYYPQIRKEGLVVDVRSNGGGNVSSMIIERLARDVMGTRFGRTAELPSTYPGTAFHGHMVCLISETSASDGDIFPHYFREAKLGPLIGKKTWGGVVGGGNIGLIDGGSVFVPRSATNDRDGNYIIEGIGVPPDIEVENDPASVIGGGDPQLERGIAEVLAAIAREPMSLPERPADPVKTPGSR
ncbi:MAG: S41 family peptidase [Planctomycetota bacterium]